MDRRGPVDRVQHLGVVHVPKCGGSAVRAAIAALPGVYAGPAYHDDVHFGSVPPADRTFRREEFPAPQELGALVAGHRIVMGHYSASALLVAGCEALATVVREPRARVLSLYRFWQGFSAAESATWGVWGERVAHAERPLAEFLAAPGVWAAVEDVQARQLLGGRPEERRLRLGLRAGRAAPSYRRLLAALQVVERSTSSERFVERVADLLGEPCPALGRANESRPGRDDQRLDRSVLDLLGRITRVDRQLLGQLAADGRLASRTQEQDDAELAETAERLGFQVRW